MSLENLLVHRNGALIIDMGMCLRIPFEQQTAPIPAGRNNHTSLATSFGNLTVNGTTRTSATAPAGNMNELTGFPPWERACPTDDRFRYMTAGYLVQMLTEWEIGLSGDAMDLLQRMLFLDPKDRLCLQQVKAHPWMTNGPLEAPVTSTDF